MLFGPEFLDEIRHGHPGPLTKSGTPVANLVFLPDKARDFLDRVPASYDAPDEGLVGFPPFAVATQVPSPDTSYWSHFCTATGCVVVLMFDLVGCCEKKSILLKSGFT